MTIKCPKCGSYHIKKRSGSPTRIESAISNIHWIIFDIYDVNAERFLPYEYVYQRAYQFKIPIVRVIDRFIPASLEELNERIQKSLTWCRRHRREGVVLKNYKHQIFAKEKIDLPKLPRLPRKEVRPQYPPMPKERIMRALQHALDQVGIENWSDKRITMPAIARHIATEAREHNFAPPKNFYKIYIETPIEDIS